MISHPFTVQTHSLLGSPTDNLRAILACWTRTLATITEDYVCYYTSSGMPSREKKGVMRALRIQNIDFQLSHHIMGFFLRQPPPDSSIPPSSLSLQSCFDPTLWSPSLVPMSHDHHGPSQATPNKGQGSGLDPPFVLTYNLQVGRCGIKVLSPAVHVQKLHVCIVILAL